MTQTLAQQTATPVSRWTATPVSRWREASGTVSDLGAFVPIAVTLIVVTLAVAVLAGIVVAHVTRYRTTPDFDRAC
jgi:hypothetical protein